MIETLRSFGTKVEYYNDALPSLAPIRRNAYAPESFGCRRPNQISASRVSPTFSVDQWNSPPAQESWLVPPGPALGSSLARTRQTHPSSGTSLFPLGSSYPSPVGAGRGQSSEREPNLTRSCNDRPKRSTLHAMITSNYRLVASDTGDRIVDVRLYRLLR